VLLVLMMVTVEAEEGRASNLITCSHPNHHPNHHAGIKAEICDGQTTFEFNFLSELSTLRF
jgi:hypothetical protein